MSLPNAPFLTNVNQTLTNAGHANGTLPPDSVVMNDGSVLHPGTLGDFAKVAIPAVVTGGASGYLTGANPATYQDQTTGGPGTVPTPGTTSTGGTTAASLTPLLALLPLITTMLKGSNQPNPGQLIGSIPGGQDVLNSVLTQNAQKAPLRQAVTQQAMNMLPNSAFPGGRPSIPQGTTYAPASQPSGGSGPGLGTALGLLGAGIGGNLLGAGGLNLASWLKNLFGGGSTSGVNAPQPGNNFPWQGPLNNGGNTTPPAWSGPVNQTPDPGALTAPVDDPSLGY